MLPFYHILFNRVFESGYIPTTWLEGIIIPLYKNKGEVEVPNNYRPITILSCLGKLFTSILNLRLTTYLENFQVLEENQAGFRKGYSCTDHMFTLHSLVEILKKNKKKLFCCFIDFSQAFDRVWRAGLLHKLLENSINGKFFNVIDSMYKNIKSSVQHNGDLSETFISEIGVRQGENLSPALFSLFLNDLNSHMYVNGANGVELKDPLDLSLWLKLLILLYADDTIFLSETEIDFQKSLDIFHNYCNNWHLKVNISKTKVIVFGSRQTKNYNFTLGNDRIEITKQYHYLGMTFSSNGSYLQARKHVAQQATKAMYLLLSKVRKANLPIDLTLKLFDHTVVPILTYGSEIFGFENVGILEKVHNEFLRKITKAKRATPISFLHGELGRFPISLIINCRMISYWNRLLLGKESKISLQIYKYMFNLPDNSFKWMNKIKEILTSVGRPDLWDNQFQISDEMLHKKIKRILIDQFKQTWHENLQKSNKGKIYLGFKENTDIEPYLIKLEDNDRLNLFRFRTVNNSLPIETGRYDGTPFEERYCNLCHNNSTGTEEHYLLHCEYFSRERNMLLNPTNLGIPLHNISFKTLMQSTSVTILKIISKLCSVIINKFQSH